jgi:hypothetical protein
MRKLLLTGSTMLALGMAAGIAGCSSSPSATTTVVTHKKAFCDADVKLDKAGANVNTDAGFLVVLKANTAALDAMDKNAPAGKVGDDARTLVSLVRSAIKTNNTNALFSSSSGADVDTYCGVNGFGNPLPSYFATGKGSTFCTAFLPIYEAVGNATSPAGVLAVLDSNKTQISRIATQVSGLPTSIKAKASAVVSEAQTAITDNSAAAVKGNGNGNGPASLVALYCGQNQ